MREIPVFEAGAESVRRESRRSSIPWSPTSSFSQKVLARSGMHTLISELEGLAARKYDASTFLPDKPIGCWSLTIYWILASPKSRLDRWYLGIRFSSTT